MKRLRKALTFFLLSPLFLLGAFSAAAPQFGAMIFQGRSGKTYPVDVYHSDVNDTLIRFDGGAGAGAATPDYWSPPEPVVLVDYSIVTGMTDTTKIQLLRNNAPIGGFLRFAMWLNTLAKRPILAIGFLPGHQVRALQKT